MVIPDRNQYIRLGLGQLRAHHGYSLFDLGGAGRLLLLLKKAWHEWVVGDADDCDEFSHGATSWISFCSCLTRLICCCKRRIYFSSMRGIPRRLPIQCFVGSKIIFPKGRLASRMRCA